MKFRQFFCSLCVAALLVSALPAAWAADAAAFTDAKDIQHWEAVATLTKLGVVNGKEDGSFDPAAPVTRAECAKLITTMLAGGKDFTPETAASSFSDTQEHWAKDYIENCVRLGIISGRGDGTFAPDDQVSLYQLFKMTEVMLEDYDKEYLTGEYWESHATFKAVRLNLYNGLVDPVPSYEQRIIDIPADYPLSREEAAQVLFNALAYVPSVFVESTDANGEACWVPAEKTDANGTPLSFLFEHFGVTEVSVPAQPK